MPINVETLISLGVEGLFYILLFAFTLHALFLGYHWFSYGESRSISLMALAIYLGGGAVLFITISGTMLYL
jgi:hypothetical protein